MKKMITLCLALCTLNSFAQNQDTSTVSQPRSTDTLNNNSEMKIFRRANSIEFNNNKIIIIQDSSDNNSSEFMILTKKGYKKSSKKDSNRRRNFEGHWSGFRYGFVNFATNDYSNYSEGTKHFMDLDWSNSFSMQFNIFQHSINLVPNNNFGLITGLGLEYQRLRFENKYTSITENEDGMIMPLALKDLGLTNVKKNSLKILYLTIPLIAEVQFPVKSNHRLYVSGGFTGGVRLHSKTKIVYNDDEGDKHKKKNTDNFNIIPFKADVVAAIGYRDIQVWGSYSLTHLFKNNQGPKLNAYAIGLGYTL